MRILLHGTVCTYVCGFKITLFFGGNLIIYQYYHRFILFLSMTVNCRKFAQDTRMPWIRMLPSIRAKLIYILEIHDMQMRIFPTRKLAIRVIANIVLWRVGGGVQTDAPQSAIPTRINVQLLAYGQKLSLLLMGSTDEPLHPEREHSENFPSFTVRVAPHSDTMPAKKN